MRRCRLDLTGTGAIFSTVSSVSISFVVTLAAETNGSWFTTLATLRAEVLRITDVTVFCFVGEALLGLMTLTGLTFGPTGLTLCTAIDITGLTVGPRGLTVLTAVEIEITGLTVGPTGLTLSTAVDVTGLTVGPTGLTVLTAAGITGLTIGPTGLTVTDDSTGNRGRA